MAKTSIGREVVQEGSLQERLEAAIRERVREVIELILEEEVDAALGAGCSQRVAERCGYRHGRKPRRLTLRTGAVDLAVPRGRLVTPDGGEREWHSQLVPRYRRSSAEVEQSVLSVYLSGSNTRRIRGAPEALLSGAALSKSAVSRLVLRLEESYRLWQRRDLAEERILYLYFVHGCDSSDGAQRGESGVAGGAGGVGSEGHGREGVAESDERRSGEHRRLADVAGRPGLTEDGPSATGDE
ncbi:MAG: transposase [Acidobacteriia bacterium]|nr:transposase [Terriglobia bacterium]